MKNTRLFIFFSTGCLREIGLNMAKELCNNGYHVIPGQKLCPKCRSLVSKPKENPDEIDNTEPEEECHVYSQEELQLDSSRESLNSTLNDLDLSPIKLHSIAPHSKPILGKRKLKEVEGAITKKLASVLKVNENEIETNEQSNINKETQSKADDLDYLVECIKDKLKVSNRRGKLQLLTLVPNSWSVRKAANVFSVSKSTIQKARILKAEKGIAGCPEIVKRQRLSQEVIDTIIEFYCDDEFSRQLPGKKDCVSVGKNNHVSKRLLLCNLKELYTAYKLKYPGKQIGFSKFASLRPKWCILVGPKGTHSVCVCTMHQNVKLMLSAINLEKSCHSLIEMIVCNRDSKTCMVHRCQKCPGIKPVQQFLEDHLLQHDSENEDGEDPDEMEIDFKQWAKVDRTELLSIKLPINEFIELLLEKLDNITTHSFIAKAQSSYLKHLKETLKSDEAIVLGDFAENYSFVIQDEIQGYHWNKSQCSLHPIVIYHSSNNFLLASSICILSDDLDHDVSFVYKVMDEAVKHIKTELIPSINTIHYFSDGCAGQYKNRKHFYNLCHHADDFSVKCKWNFFATSHGKSPCDGIGGTVKRLAARASLQRTTSCHILSAEQMFEFCKESIPGIKFVYVSSTEINTTRTKLDSRFSMAKTIPGTRSYHQYVPESTSTIKMKRISDDDVFEAEFDFLGNKACLNMIKVENVRVSQYLVCKYDEQYWIGIVSEVDQDAKDALI